MISHASYIQPGESMNQPRLQHMLRLAACALAAATLPLQLASAQTSTQPAAPTIQSLHRDFVNPPNAARPMVRWWWFGAAVVKPEILHELQQMKADGIQGAELAFEYPEVLDDPSKDLKNLPFLSPEMLDDVHYAQAEGRKLGLRIDVTLCSGWPYGGPHITPEEAVHSLHTIEVPVAANATSASIPSNNATGRQVWFPGDQVISAVITDPAAPTAPAATPAFGRGGRGGGGGPRPASFNPATAMPVPFTGLTATFPASDHPASPSSSSTATPASRSNVQPSVPTVLSLILSPTTPSPSTSKSSASRS